MTRQRGFTLLELLVAVAIFAVVSALAYEGLSQAITLRRRLDQERRTWQALALTFSEMRQDLAQARSRPVRDGTGMMTPAFVGVPQDETDYNGPLLEWTRGGALGPGTGPGSDLERVGYELRDQRLSRLVWSDLDRAPGTKPVRSVLVTGVRQLRIRYYGNNGQWSRVWPLPGGQITDLPRGMRVTMRLTGQGTITRWFVVAD